jgi:hypothetical protein
MANLLLINFGTFIETHRFKAFAAKSEFTATDLLDSTTPGPGELIQEKGVQHRPNVGGARVHSFYDLSSTVWKSKLSDGTAFKDAFKKWFENALSSPAHCVYMTGHHWGAGDVYTTLSWGDDTTYFHARFDTDKQKLSFGVEGDRVEIDTKNLRAECKLVFGFGCNVCTGSNSTKYQTFFSPSKPVLCGWDHSITLPKSEAKSVNKRFFEYLDIYIDKDPKKVPGKDRLIWFYDNDPFELVKAWGWATKHWKQSNARARDKDGTYYKFKVNKKGWPEPTKA